MYRVGLGPIAESVTLAVGGTATFTLDATVASSATTSVANTAVIALPAGAADPTPANNTATDVDTVTRRADLAITKTDGATTATPGGTATYTIVASNGGLSDVVGATVADALPAGATSMSWTCLAGGASNCSASGSGAISESVDIVAGSSVTFTVVVSISSTATGNLTNTASITEPPGVTDPTPGNNTASDTDVLQPIVDISVTNTDGVVTAVPGATTTYTIVVSNAGPSAAPGTVVDIPTPAGGTITGWTCVGGSGTCGSGSGSGTVASTADLPAGGSVTYTVTVAIDEGATGTITTIATATASPGIDDSDLTNNTASDIDTLTPVSDLSITKTDGAASATPGTAITYTIVVSNSGPSTVVGAPVIDALPAALGSVTWTCSATVGSACTDPTGAGDIASSVDLLSGGSATYIVDAVISPSATGTLDNTAVVGLPSGVTDPDAADRSATDSDTLAPVVDLSITKTDGLTAVPPLSSTSYTIVVSNSGPSTATDAIVSDPIPASLVGAAWTCTDAAGGTCDVAAGSGDVTATVDLAPGGSVTFTVVATVAASATGTISNTATVAPAAGTTETDGADNSATDTTAVSLVADLAVTKTDGLTNVSSGGNSTYTIVVTNSGPSDVVGASFADVIPTGLAGVTWTCTSEPGSACGAASGSGSISESIDLASGTSVTYSVSATVSALDGTISNTASIAAPTGTTDPIPGNDAATDTTEVDPVGNLSITKTDGQTTVVAGTATSYTIVVTNDGPSDVTGIDVTDALPAALTGAVWTCAASAGATCSAPNGTGDISTTVDLDAGATATFIVNATVAPETTGVVANTAAITPPANYTDTDPTDDSATDTSNSTSQADLSITKTNATATSVPGAGVTYTIAVTNAGPSTVVGATVADSLPAALVSATWTCSATAGASCSNPSGTGSINEAVTIAPTATVTFVVTATVASTATGQLTNTATVTAPGGTTDPVLANNSATDTDDLTPRADLTITKTDGVVSATPGAPTTYTIVATNTGPSAVTGAVVTDTLPASLTSATWICAASAGSSCAASGSGNISELVNLAVGRHGAVHRRRDDRSRCHRHGRQQRVGRPTVWRHRSDTLRQLGDRHHLADPAGRPADHQDRRRHNVDSRPERELHDHCDQSGALECGGCHDQRHAAGGAHRGDVDLRGGSRRELRFRLRHRQRQRSQRRADRWHRHDHDRGEHRSGCHRAAHEHGDHRRTGRRDRGVARRQLRDRLEHVDPPRRPVDLEDRRDDGCAPRRHDHVHDHRVERRPLGRGRRADRRHHSARARQRRLDVRPGAGCGMWCAVRVRAASPAPPTWRLVRT